MGKRGKGTEPGSSSQAQKQPKKIGPSSMYRSATEDLDIDTEPVMENEEWKSGLLTNFPHDQQASHFIAKMDTLVNKKEGFLCEKDVPVKQFGPFGIYKKFKALGWEAALKCYDGTSKVLHMDAIEEWVSTLKLVEARNPTQTQLVGWVNEHEVTMSFNSLKQIAPFDSKGTKSYTYPSLDVLFHNPEGHPNWDAMVDDLFILNRNPNVLLRDELRLKAKMIHLIMCSNVLPRRGDKMEVRFIDIPILHALVYGTPLVSFRYLVIYNIWLSRISFEKKTVPYCRLIEALLRKTGAITNESEGITKRYTPYKLENLGINWVFLETDTQYVVMNGAKTRKWSVLKNGAQEDSGDEEVEENEEDVEMGDEESDEDDVDGGAGTSRHVSSEFVGGQQFPTGGSHFGFPAHGFEYGWAHQGTMQEVVMATRPSEYQRWPRETRTMFDYQVGMAASHERAAKIRHDEDANWHRAHAYAFQQEVNFRYEDDRQRRMHDQWHNGREIVADPPVIDYASLPPFDGSVTYPTPPLHHSPWIDPRQESSSSSQQPPQDGAFGFGEFTDTFTQIFGPPQPRYY